MLKMVSLFSTKANIVIYVTVIVLWILGFYFKTNITLYLGLLIFLCWDILFLFSEDAFKGRDTNNILLQTRSAREQIAYFLPFYGFLFSILFTLEAGKREQFFDLLNKSGVPVYLLVLPFIIASSGILFIPVKIQKGKDSNKITNAMKSLLFIAVFFQKVAIFSFVHIILRIVGAIDIKI